MKEKKITNKIERYLIDITIEDGKVNAAIHATDLQTIFPTKQYVALAESFKSGGVNYISVRAVVDDMISTLPHIINLDKKTAIAARLREKIGNANNLINDKRTTDRRADSLREYVETLEEVLQEVINI